MAPTFVAATTSVFLVTGCWRTQDSVSEPMVGHQQTSEATIATIVTIPAGTYVVGCEVQPMCEDNPQQRVELQAFRIDRFQVLDSRYEQCEHHGGCPKRFHYSLGGVNAPDEVAIVPPEGAEVYCRWRGGHLPSSVEWESAGRGAKGYYYPWGNAWTEEMVPGQGRQRYADLVKDYPRSGTRPDLRSGFGLEDMSGNAPEFVRGRKGIESRGRPNPRHHAKAVAADYSLVMIHSTDDAHLGAFRCAY